MADVGTEEVKNLKVSTIQKLLSLREVILLYLVILLLWGLYRLLFRLPVWFEEVVLKAVVFGIPVYLTSRRHQWNWKDLGITGTNLSASVYMGIFLGVMLGIVGNIGNIIRHGGLALAPFGLSSETMGGFLILSLITAFWEQLLFCGMFGRLLGEMFRDEWSQAWMVTLLFVGLHLPSLVFIQHLPAVQLAVAVILLVLLQLGNMILFFRYKNLAAPVMAQALWGVTVFLFR
jgi:hypothetical protein